MTKQYTPILTAYFFVLKTHLEGELETVLLNCKENGITVKVYEPNGLITKYKSQKSSCLCFIR